MTVHGAYFEVTGAESEMFRIVEAIQRNDGRLTTSSSASLDIWQEMLEEWFEKRDATVKQEALAVVLDAAPPMNAELSMRGGDGPFTDPDMAAYVEGFGDAVRALRAWAEVPSR